MTQRDSPVPVDLPAGTRIKQIAAGSHMSEVLEANGTVWGAGRDYEGEMGNGTISSAGVDVPTQASITGVAAIAAGQYTVYALKNDGTVWAWGFNAHGELGDGSVSDQSLTPVQVVGLSNVVAVAGEEFGGLALRSDGTVWAWGYNANGELGNGTTNESTTPVQVQGLTGVTAIAGGMSFGLARRSDGTVWAWGSDSGRQLGISSWADQSTPVEVLAPGGGSPLTGVIAIAAGSGQAFAIRSDGSLVAWGYNGDGEIGNNNAPTDADPTVVLTGVEAVAGGWSHTLALKQNGTLWAWGSNSDGELGIGSSGGQENAPVQVNISGTVVAIAAGQGASIALIRGSG
jgi:alpha-tubulin suppressor-like RCC1 family protein